MSNRLINSNNALRDGNGIYCKWIIETDDKGRFPETDEALKAVIDRWGDNAINKEYKRVR